MSNNIEALIVKIKKQTESFDTVILKEDEAKALIAALEQAQHDRDMFSFAHKEWNDKTEWVQKESTSGRFGFQVLGMHRADVMTRHIDDLENDEVRQRLANAEHQLYMADLTKHNLKASRKAQFRKRKAAERRVNELEARTLSFKLPDPSSKAFWGGTGKNETFYSSTYKRWLTEAIERAGIIAGVKIEIK